MEGSATGATPQERSLLDAARAGDEGAFAHLIEPHRAGLHAHCYRMLGSVHDAEDALQDAMLRAWRGLARFEGRSSTRNWLYRIATNACIDLSARRPARILPLDTGPAAGPHEAPGRPLSESVWLEPYPDVAPGLEDGLASPGARLELRESVELAFVAALQHVPARQRAVLILRDVLGFSAAEAAETLGLTSVSVNSALQRARKAVDERVPAPTQQSTLRQLGDARMRELVARYMDAMERADVDAVLALLVDDPTWSMPPMATWYRGRDAIAAFLREHAFSQRWRHLPTRANGQLAVGCYAWDDACARYRAEVVDVLTLDGDRIREVTAFVSPAVPPRFGLPLTLAP
jgi:RNA polymerase sigma-70 factor (ECF subfamily)